MSSATLLADLHPLFVLFAIVGVGLGLGRITVKGISLGSSGVLFVALLAGHFGAETYGGVGTIGLVLFVYAVGIGAGGRFFAALAREGSILAQLALLVTVLGAALAWGMSVWLEIPADLAVGIFAGALTSTPALAAATETLKEAGELVPIGYGIAYPFGVVGVVLFVQLLPRLLKVDLEVEADAAGEGRAEEQIRSVVVKVTHRELEGQCIAEFDELAALGVQVTRVRDGQRGVPLRYDDCFVPGQELVLVGQERALRLAVHLLGHASDAPILRDVERERRQLIILDRRMAGQPLKDLRLLREYGVTISRITRLGFTFVPTSETVLERNDVATVVGDPDALERFARAVGHRSQAFDETDLLSLGVGLALGIVVGQLKFGLPGVGELTLGLAGGPLLVGLLLGHFGRMWRIVGHIPRPTRLLLQELGLVFFLCEAGLRGGGAFGETLQAYGMTLFLMGLVITLVPMLGAYFFARKVLKINVLQALGGICGGMTSTPALGALTAKTDSQVPVVSYAAAYPVALILMTIFAKILIQLVQAFGF
ncbi:MAG: aspartate:alanine exchanger family transporter [Opitutales bacterium]